MTELCNWAKSIAKWTPRLDRPHNPNLIVPQRWLCKMGIMPPCSCKMSVEKNLTIFVNSLNPELWVCFLPWPRRESELFQADAQLSCPARNDLLLVLLQENIAVGSWGSSPEPAATSHANSATHMLPAKGRQPSWFKTNFHDSAWCSISNHIDFGQEAVPRDKKRTISLEMVKYFACFLHVFKKGEPFTSMTLTKSIWHSELCTIHKAVLFHSYNIFFSQILNTNHNS